MNLEELMLDAVQRLVRVETKVDGLLEAQQARKRQTFQVYLAIVSSLTAIGIAIFK